VCGQGVRLDRLLQTAAKSRTKAFLLSFLLKQIEVYEGSVLLKRGALLFEVPLDL